MTKYTEGIVLDGAGILRDGKLITISEILDNLNTIKPQKVYLLQGCDEIDGYYTLQVYKNKKDADKICKLANDHKKLKPLIGFLEEGDCLCFNAMDKWKESSPIAGEYGWDSCKVKEKELL